MLSAFTATRVHLSEQFPTELPGGRGHIFGERSFLAPVRRSAGAFPDGTAHRLRDNIFRHNSRRCRGVGAFIPVFFGRGNHPANSKSSPRQNPDSRCRSAPAAGRRPARIPDAAAMVRGVLLKQGTAGDETRLRIAHYLAISRHYRNPLRASSGDQHSVGRIWHAVAAKTKNRSRFRE